ncbi:hypothetical protein [Agromyces ramosus]|uniref:Uncharacterized protein n=1 Tax=Agromyces ramosus TaxID=33879 RepID=A0ABU0R9Q4_9MICO|nr:hypothetical protein [Agromyces ramosus]MDQ0894808.1 hypothetical protein [Agromyces ramosus]
MSVTPADEHLSTERGAANEVGERYVIGVDYGTEHDGAEAVTA